MARSFARAAVVMAAALLSVGQLSCIGASDVYLVGQVYDGATGERLTSYQMTVYYRDQKIVAQVQSDNGRFVVPRLPVFQDYTVEITASGYRPFRSHNPMFNVPNPGSSLESAQGSQTFYFDAYLFPSALASPALTLTVRKGTSTGDPAAGKVRIRPASLSNIADTTSELPSGVGTQLWLNDEDLQAKPIAKDFTGGTITIAAGELIYGVRYQVNVYEVAGYQPLEATFVSGTDGSRTLVVTEETLDPLSVLRSTIATCKGPTTPTDTLAAVVSFEFNLDIELSPTTLAGGWAEQVDNAFTISSPDTGNLGTRNILALNASSSAQERGTSLSVSGKTLTFSWNPNVGLSSKDAADPIMAIWSLGSVQVQPVGRNQPRTLQSLVPSAFSISCGS